ncbi:monocarboxylate transporter 12-like [Ornithodoros turicata]|uniref:monocarboxylate transporter 12-like n=1 Tax=Ornithodoros turicata TaxID=34597 RepID=UPI0031388303
MEVSQPIEELSGIQYKVHDHVSKQRPELVDSRHSWIVALACSWVQIWISLIYRSAGVFLVSMVATFEIPRQQASWPLVINLSCNCIMAVFSGFLLRWTDSRFVAVSGCIIASLSIMACFMWNEPVGYIVLMGFCFGIGSGLAIPTCFVVLSRYFKRNRACANGITLAGASFGSIIFPPVVTLLNEKYGLRGATLLIGGLIMNGVAGGLVMRSSTRFPVCACSHKMAKSPASLQPISTPKYGALSVIWRTVSPPLSFLKNGYFYPITLAGMVYNFSLTTYLLTIVDHAVGHGLSRAEASLLLSTMSFADLISRLCTGPITDHQFLSRKQMLVVSFTMLSICYLVLPMMTTRGNMITLSIVFGLSGGGAVIILPVLLVEHLGIDNLPVAFGVHRMAIGLSTLARPVLIGECIGSCKSGLHCICLA